MSDEHGGWKIVREVVQESFPIFEIKKSTRINPRSKTEIDFILIDGLDWVTVLPITPQNEVVLIKQYRHGSEGYSIEIPGGCVERGEQPIGAAARELKEETGFEAQGLKLLGTFHPNPPMYGMKCHAFFAPNVQKKAIQKLDAGEDIEVFLKPLKEFFEMIKRGEITHAIVMASALLYKQKIGIY